MIPNGNIAITPSCGRAPLVKAGCSLNGAAHAVPRMGSGALGFSLAVAFDAAVVRAGSPVVRVSAPTPGAVAASSRCTAWRRWIVAPIPARARYLLSAAIGVVAAPGSRIIRRRQVALPATEQQGAADNGRRYQDFECQTLHAGYSPRLAEHVIGVIATPFRLSRYPAMAVA